MDKIDIMRLWVSRAGFTCTDDGLVDGEAWVDFDLPTGQTLCMWEANTERIELDVPEKPGFDDMVAAVAAIKKIIEQRQRWRKGKEDPGDTHETWNCGNTVVVFQKEDKADIPGLLLELGRTLES